MTKRMLQEFVLLMALMDMTAVACGSSEGEDDSFSKISDPGKVFSLDDLIATPYKEVSNYSTEGLPGASDVSFGFMKIGNGEPYDYEVRFYESHQAAVDIGTAMANEGTGADAILSEDDATYKPGVKNRRTIIGGGVGGGARSGIGPKFGSYAIFGNIVMLCQGSDVETSLERCGLMAKALVPNE
ncbi:MAG: DUF6810 family protein [Dehalococcoidia bacterium]